jgi:hypothetical protein
LIAVAFGTALGIIILDTMLVLFDVGVQPAKFIANPYSEGTVSLIIICNLVKIIGAGG